MKKPLKQRILRIADKALTVGSDIADVAIHLKENSGPIGVASVALRAVKSLAQVVGDSDPREAFSGWSYISLAPIEDFVYSILAKHHLLTTVQKSEGGTVAVAATIADNLVVGWVIHPTWKDGPYIMPGQDEARTKAAVGYLIWQAVGKAVVLETPVIGPYVLHQDPLSETLASKTAANIWRRQQAFLQRGYSRSVLLYGEPGTGKSHIIRQVAKEAGGTSLRLKARSMSGTRNLANLVAILNPSALLIDDFDRVEEAESVLDTFEEIRASAQLFMATVNDVSKLDTATLRPGRFDDIHEVEHLDPEVIERLLQDVPARAAAALRKMPITYIDHFQRMQQVLGPAEALKELKAYKKRIEYIRSRNDEDDAEEKGPEVNKKKKRKKATLTAVVGPEPAA